MPINKNAQLRYQILDRCFSNVHRDYTFSELLEKVNDELRYLNGTSVSRRQLWDDIREMQYEPFKAPIESIATGFGREHIYRYSDPDFSIYKSALSDQEIANLRTTIEMLGRYRGLPSYAWLEEVISNLEYRFGIKSNSENVIEFDQNEQLKGLEFLSDFIDATVAHQPISIVYRTFSGRETTTTFHPYYVKQFNNRWFLFGLEEDKKYGNHIANRALDRIVSFTPLTNVPFIQNKDIDFKVFFKDIIGVTIPHDNSAPEEIILKFDEKRYPYIVSKPLHHSQQVVSEQDHTLSICVRPNKELESQILYFGPQVEVLKPEWLREQIAEKIAANYKKYFPCAE